MSTGFDPYRKWLGIPPQDQPANHYRLLGLTVFEEDPEIIEDAAVRQIAYVRTFQTGKYAQFSQKLLNELSAARIVLLQRDKKRAYDAELRQQMAVQSPEAEYAEPVPEYPPAFPQQHAGYRQPGFPQPSYPPEPTFPFPQPQRPEPRFYAPPEYTQPAAPQPPPPPAGGTKRVPVGKVVPVGKPVVRAVTPPASPVQQPAPAAATPPAPPKKKNVPIPVPKEAPPQYVPEEPPVGQAPAGQFPDPTAQFPSPAYQTPGAPARRGAPAPARRGAVKGGSKKQNPVPLVLGGMGIVCVLALGAVVYVFTREPEKPKIAKRPTPPVVVEEPVVEPVAEPAEPIPAMPMSKGITPVSPMPTNIVPIPPTPPVAPMPMPMNETPAVTPMPETPLKVKPAPPEKPEDPVALFNASRKALQERDMEGFQTKFETLDKMLVEYTGPNAAQLKQNAEHLKEVGKLLKQFWDTVSETASKGMVPGERYRFRGKVFEFSSFNGGEMEYRYDGKRESSTPKEFPPDIALIIAYRAFGNDDVEGKTVIAMFASFDPAAIKDGANQSMVARMLQDFENFGDEVNKTMKREHDRIPDNPMSGEADVSPPQRMKIK